MNDVAWTGSLAKERAGAFEARAPEPGQGPHLMRGALAKGSRRRWEERLKAGRSVLHTLGPVVRKGLHEADGIAGTLRSSGTQARASAQAALLGAPGRLREGASRAVDAAGFGPVRLLLSRHPGLALALGMPVLISSLFLSFWSGVSAVLLGLWCVTISLILVNQAARGMLQGDADPTHPSTTETLR